MEEQPQNGATANHPEVNSVKEPVILETPEDVRNRRNQVLDRYAAFKEATDERRRRLEDAKRYQYFKRDADELESWIQEKLQTYSSEDYKDLTNLQVFYSFLFTCALEQEAEASGSRVGSQRSP